ncbi:MAG: hypothetical protein AAGC60_26750 [Acidobacteriota bacterium]
MGPDPVLVESVELTFPIESLALDADGDLWIANGDDGLLEIAIPTISGDGFERGALSAVGP